MGTTRGIKEIREKLDYLQSKCSKLEKTRLRCMCDGIEAHIVREQINLLRWVIKEQEINYPEYRITIK